MSKITKLGLGIVAFEGTEHIKNITYEIRDYVDEIIVCLQKKSYCGNPIDNEDVNEVEELLNHGWVDKIVWFSPVKKYDNIPEDDKKTVQRLIETDKRNFILDILENDGCSHSMIIDSDEFYNGGEFKEAKDCFSNDPDMKVSYCRYLNYWQDYYHYLVWSHKTYVPFITEAKYRFSFNARCFNGSIDLTRIYFLNEGEYYHTFSWDKIHMHHFSWIRKDIKKKIECWSSLPYFDSGIKDVVYNAYIKWKPYLCAKIIGPKLIVEYLGEKYVHPHYRLNQEIEDYYAISDSDNVSKQ